MECSFKKPTLCLLNVGKLFLFKWAKPASFCLILFFSNDNYSTNLTLNDKSVDVVFGTRTQGSRIVGADEPTE